MKIPHLDLRLQHGAVDVWLNDMPLHRAAADEHRFLTMPVAEFVRKGENTLTVVPQPGGTPATSRQPQPGAAHADARFEAKLVLYAEGEFPGSGAGQDLIVVAGGGPTPWPATAQTQGRNLPFELAPWAWERAETLGPGTALQAAVLQVLKAAHTAFAARDAEFFLRLGKPYFADHARAYPALSEAQRAQRFRAGLAALPADSWRVAPLVPAQFDWRLCAQGRLLELVDQQFQPLLRAESMRYPFPVFLGILDGQLQMLR